MKNILVTGANGQLGTSLALMANSADANFFFTDVDTLDITDYRAVSAYMKKNRIDIVINCAAYTNVDKAETEPEICAAVNGMGTLYMVRAALSVGAKLVYISTDYVFPGTGDQPFGIDDPYGPKNVYGVSKVQGEDAVRSLMTRYYILRTSWVFGKNGKNFVRTMLRLGAEKKELRVVSDQIGSPTYAKDLARVICDMIPTDKYGIYHVRNEGYVSWADFAKMIMEKSGLSCRIIPVPSSEYITLARRPLNSRLSGKKLQAAGFAPMPTVADALDRYLAELKEEKSAE